MFVFRFEIDRWPVTRCIVSMIEDQAGSYEDSFDKVIFYYKHLGCEEEYDYRQVWKCHSSWYRILH